MKLRLPILLLNSVLACFMFSGIAQAVTISADTSYSENTDWTEATTIGANNLSLTIAAGVTVTQSSGGFNIGSNNLTLKGGGVLKINTAATVRISSPDPAAVNTLTIDGMTLDLSNPAAKLSLTETASGGDAYSRLYMMVKSGGMVKVDNFSYDGSFGACGLSSGYFKLDNGTIQISNANDSNWQHGLEILAGGGKVENVTVGKTVTMASHANNIARGAFLTIAGVGNFDAGMTANFLTGAGGVIKDGSGSLTIGVDQNFGGGVELKGGTLVASTANALGTNKVLKVSGNSSLGGVSSALSGLTLSSGVSFNVAAVDNNAGLILNGNLNLQGSATITGNLNIGRGNTLSLTSQPVAGTAVLALNGALTLDGTLLFGNSSSFTWSAGNTYDIISATSVSGSLSNPFLLSNTVYGKWVVGGNKLQLATFNLDNLTWAGGGNSTWSLNGASADSPWADKVVYNDETRVIFGNVAGSSSEIVTIAGDVSPVGLVVNASSTNYIWSGSGKLSGNGSLHKSGAGSLVINTANTSYSGEVTFGGGNIEMGTETALGSGVLLFDGGVLKYGTGITKDVSSQLGKRTGLSNVVRVDTNGGGISWNNMDKSLSLINTGEGSLTLAGGTYTGNLSNSGAGTLFLGSGTYNGVLSNTGNGQLILDGAFTLSGASAGLNGVITKRGTGNLTMKAAAFNNSSASSTLVVEGGSVLFDEEGTYSGGMSIHLKEKGTSLNVAVGLVNMTGSGTLTMGAETKLILQNGNSAGGNFGMNIVMDALGSYVTISGSIYGSSSAITKSISGVGDLHIINDLYNDNALNFKGGWVNNSYVGNTKIATDASTTKISKFIYNGSGGAVSNGQTLTPWGVGDVTIGGVNGIATTVIFSNLQTNFDYSINNAITLNGNNQTTTLELLTNQTGKMKLNGVLTVQSAGANGNVVVNAGKQLELLGGLSGAGTVAINMAAGSNGLLTLASNNSGFTGNLTVTNADKLYLNSTGAIGGTISTAGGVYVNSTAQTVGTLSAGSLGFTASAISGFGSSVGLTATTLNMTGAGASAVMIDVDSVLDISTSYKLATWTTLTGSFSSSTTMTGTFSSLYTGTLSTSGGVLTLTLARAANTNVWSGASGIWKNGVGDPWQGGVAFAEGQSVFFGNPSGGAATITVNGPVKPAAIVFGNTEGTYTISMASGGGSIEDMGVGSGYTPISLTKEGAGTLVIAMSNNYSGGTYLKGGILVMANENALGAPGAANKIYFNGGTLKYGTGITKDISDRIAAVVSGVDNTIRVDTNGNNVSWGTTVADRDYVKSGSGTLALSPADGTNFTKSITIDGGALSLSANTGSVTLSGNMYGSGMLVKEGSANLFITSASNNFSGTLDIKGGTTVVGAASTTGGGSDAVLGAASTIIVGNGASFRTHLGGVGKTFAFRNMYVKSGGSLGNIDGHASYTGNIHFNVDTIGTDGSATYNASGSVSLFQFYAKTIGLNGVVAGSGIVNLISGESDTGKDHRFVLKNTGNTFNGTYVLGSEHLTTIELGASDSETGGVAKNAHFKLDSQKACLVVSGASASIAGLEGTLGTVSAEGGARSLTINQASGDKVFAGTMADTANGATGAVLSIVKDGAGKLTLNQNNTYTGDTTIKNGTLAIGSGKNTALGTGKVLVQGGLLDMNGTELANALTITGGNLSGAGNYAGSDHSAVINLVSTQSSLNLGGLLATKVKSISTAAAGTLVRGLGAGSLLLDNSTLAVGANNLFHVTNDVYPGGAEYILGLSDTSSTVSMSDGASLTLDLRDADLVAAMAATGDRTYQILVTNGLLNMANVNLTNAGNTFQFVGIDGGNVVISGDASNIYAVATNQQKTISSNDGLDAYNAVLVNGTLNLNLPGVGNVDDGLLVKNLNGKRSGVINVTRTGTTGTASVILNVTDETSIFDGTLNGGTANFVKTGDGTQIFGGAVGMNNLTVQEGDVELKQGSVLSLLGNGSSLASGTELKGSGSLVLNGDLTVEDGAVINGINVTLSGINSKLDIGTSDSSVSGLKGTGTLESDNGSLTFNTISGQTNTFEGVLSGSGSLNIAGSGTQVLVGGGSADYDLSVSGNGTLLIRGTSDVSNVLYNSLEVQSGTAVLQATGSNVGNSNSYLTLASGGSVASGATLSFIVNSDYPGVLAGTSPSLIKTEGMFTLASGSLVDVSSIDPNANLTNDASDALTLILIQGSNGGRVQMDDGVGLKTSGLFDVYYENTMIENIDGNLVLTGKVREENYFNTAGVTTNSAAAADLLWKNRKGLPSSSELGKLMGAAAEAVKGGDIGESSRVMAASVGSTVTSLLSAQRGSFRQQQMWIRNRTTQMGVNQNVVNEDMPYVNAWIQGNGSYSKLDTKGDESGYSLNSWGGTAGVDIDMNESLSFGTAFTADYGKLKASAADVARGDMDSYYVNLFARLQHKNWAHTLILTGAWSDSTLNRTVSYDGGGYTTHGDTSGSTWGAMYEGTYDIVLNDRKTSIFQPVVNAGLYSSRVDGYQETGAGNAGLDVGKMDETYGSLAVGARLMGIVGTNILGRSCLGEVRMMVAQDVGNVSRSANVGYLNNPAIRANVVGAKLGKTALQIGAGLSIPVGERSSIFADANADIRSGSNSVNGNIGYRYNF